MSLSRPYITYDDQALFKLIAEGKERAYEEIFVRYREKLYSVALKMLVLPEMAEEAVQEVFVSLWVSRARLVEVENPGGYLFIMTHNRVTSDLKKIALDQQLRQVLKQKYNELTHETEEKLDVREKESLVRKAIESLSPQRQLVYKLNRFEGLSYQEIADELGITKHTVRNLLAQAVKSIRAYLDEATIILIVLLFSFLNYFF